MPSVNQLLLLSLLSVSVSVASEIRLGHHGQYRDFIPIKAENITKIVLHDSQAWVLCFHNGSIFTEFKRLAASVRGLVRFGVISEEDEETVKLLNFDLSLHRFRSLSFHPPPVDESTRRFRDFATFREALDFASDSVPDTQLRRILTEQDMKLLLTEAVTSKPTRFTVLFTIRDSTPTLLHRVISHKVSRNFNFGFIPNAGSPDSPINRHLHLPVPGMSVLSVRHDGSVHSGRLDESKRPWSDMNFASLLQFLVEFNRQFRRELPGDSRADDRQVLYMTDVLQEEKLVFSVSDAQMMDGADDDQKATEDLRDEL